MSNQIPLNLRFQPSYQWQDYVVNKQNNPIIHMLDKWPNWPAPWLLIEGQVGSGKTHLAHLFTHKIKAVMMKDLSSDLDDIFQSASPIVLDIKIPHERHEQDKLFHIINHIIERKQYGVLLTEPIADMKEKDIVILADLHSRLKHMMRFELLLPDDDMLKALLVKLFSDRQLRLSLFQLNWIIPRIRRSYQFIEQYVENVDMASLSNKGKITHSLLKEELEKLM